MDDPLALVVEASAIHADRAPEYLMYRDYRDGRHRMDFASDGFRKSFGWALLQAQENLMPAIVSAHTNLLSIEAWTASESDAQDATDAGLQRLAELVHAESHTTGNAFTITWNRPGVTEPMAIFHRADQVIPFVNEEQPDVLDAAVKLWIDRDGFGRGAVYDAGHLYRFATKSKMAYQARRNDGTTAAPAYPDDRHAWQAYDAEGAPAVEAHSFGVVPVVWWKRDAISQFDPGRSVLVDAIPVQDELNKLIADAVVAGERIARPVRYVMDVAEELLKPRLVNGKLQPPTLPFDDTNTLLAMTAKGPAGQFPGPDATSIIALQQHAEQKLSRTTGIPSWLLNPTGGNVPSGTALRIMLTQLVSQAESFQRDATPSWKGQLELLGMSNPAIKWADPMPSSDEERLANAAEAKALGLPAEEWLRIGGWDPAARDESGVSLVDRVTAAQQAKVQDAVGALYAGNVGL